MLCCVFIKQSESEVAAASCLGAQQLQTMHLLQQSQVLSLLLSEQLLLSEYLHS